MIITVTLNPAMDHILVVDEFKLNVTNRIKKQFFCVGGKGTHLSVNLSILGVKNIALGVTFGIDGNRIIGELKKYENIEVNFVHSDEGNSRTNYVLVDSHTNCTLITQNGQELDDKILDMLLERYTSTINAGDFVVISSDASNSKRKGFQNQLIEIAKKKGGKLFLDCSGEALKEGIKKQPFLVKPNVDELSYFCGRDLKTEEEIIKAMNEMATYGIPNVVVSLGKEGSLVLTNNQLYSIRVPEVDVKNTVGCGDALVSGLLAGFESNLDMTTLLKRANAISSAAAMNESSVGFDSGLIDELADRVVVEKI
jgi:1-phosphofructokinase family hexose kinase